MSDIIAFDPPEPEELSDLLSGYDVSSLIATGGMGAVYAATQISLDRPVAIKLLPRELGGDNFREQFQAEARSMAKLNHPNLIGIYDFGQADGMPYIVMELVKGKSLYYSCYQTAVDQHTACELIIEICEGLAHAHKAGIIHRDIKPANILLDPEAHAKIGDFGLASQADGDGEEMAFGTPGYAAPEILEDPASIGVPSDIFAVGVILYELLTGFIPEQPPRPASTVHNSDPRLDNIIRTATRRNPRMRYQNAQDMADEIKSLLPHLGKTSGGSHGAAANPKLKLGSSSPSSAPKISRKETSQVKLTRKETSGVKLSTSKGLKRETAKVSSPKLTPLPKNSSEDEEEDNGPAIVPAPQVVPMADSGNWPIVRNLIIIAVLIPAIMIAIGKYKDKQERIANEEEKDRKERQEKSDKANADRNAAKAAAERKAAEDKLAKERAKALAAQHASGVHNPSVERTPLQQLAYLRPDLAGGRRDNFPEGSIERGNSFLFVVDSPMSWSQATQFAEEHGAHLATPESAADVAALAGNIGDLKRVWIGGGALGRTDWGWVNGHKWVHTKPSTTLGSCAALSPTGLIKARPNGEKNPFVLQWSKSGENEGTLAAQLSRLQGTLGSPSPAWPPGTMVQQNRHYLVVQRALSWDEADLIASSGNGHLAVASDGLEMNFIRDTLASSLGIDESAWLGGRRNADTWYWVTREPWKQANWQPNAPDGGPKDTALHFTNSRTEPGWNDANPDSQEIEAFLIEWSNDASDFAKSGKEDPGANNGDNGNAREKVVTWRGIIRRSLVKKTETHKDMLTNNNKFLGQSLRNWLRHGPKTQEQTYGAFIERVQEELNNNDGIPDNIPFKRLPREAQNHIERGLKTQAGHQKKFEAEVSTLRNSYLNKLLGELGRLKKAGLNSQAAIIQAEIDGMGQTNEAFKAHLTN